MSRLTKWQLQSSEYEKAFKKRHNEEVASKMAQGHFSKYLAAYDIANVNDRKYLAAISALNRIAANYSTDIQIIESFITEVGLDTALEYIFEHYIPPHEGTTRGKFGVPTYSGYEVYDEHYKMLAEDLLEDYGYVLSVIDEI